MSLHINSVQIICPDTVCRNVYVETFQHTTRGVLFTLKSQFTIRVTVKTSCNGLTISLFT